MGNAGLSRQRGLLAVFGSLLWVVCWEIVSVVGGGSRAERLWRTLLLNPAILLIMVGLVGFHRRQARRPGRLSRLGFSVCLLGTATMLLGNVVEFWVSEYFYGTQTPGWVMMGVGLLMLPGGLLLLGVGTIRARVFTGWRRGAPLGFGVLLTAAVILLILSYLAPTTTLGRTASSWAAVSPYAVIYAFALGWSALGYALWSENIV